ncbi:MAG: septum formation inhibitor [Bacteroidales bacterium]|jgi:cell division protein FtsB
MEVIPDKNLILKRLKNKYVLAAIIFIVWISFLDENNLLERFRYIRELNQLKADKEYYIQKIEEDKKRLNELKTDNKNLEKFAREQYLMKRDDEDVFVIVKE